MLKFREKFRGVIVTHEIIEKWYPPGHKDRGRMLELAHEAYQDAIKPRKRGRPKGRAGDLAILHMYFTEYRTGETRARKLAEMAIDVGYARTGGTKKSRIERLARQYAKCRASMPPSRLLGPAAPLPVEIIPGP